MHRPISKMARISGVKRFERLARIDFAQVGAEKAMDGLFQHPDRRSAPRADRAGGPFGGMKMNYNDTVMDHFTNPRNVGEVPDADGVGQVGNPACGDIMKISLRVK